MELKKTYNTVTIPLFNSNGELNKFKLEGNKLIVEYEIPQKIKRNGILSIQKNGYKINNCSFQQHEKLVFFLPENHIQSLDFESDITITYENKNGDFYFEKIDVLYSDEYLEIMESGWNLYPELIDGEMKFSNQDFRINLNSAC